MSSKWSGGVVGGGPGVQVSSNSGFFQTWHWRVDEKGRVNWPDYQTRICKNIESIQWVGKVHERLEGWKTSSIFPAEFEDWALYHPKDIDRQVKQNSLYNTI